MNLVLAETDQRILGGDSRELDVQVLLFELTHGVREVERAEGFHASSSVDRDGRALGEGLRVVAADNLSGRFGLRRRRRRCTAREHEATHGKGGPDLDRAGGPAVIP